MCVLGLLQTQGLASGGQYYAYDLVHGPWAIVYSIYTTPQEHDLFLVPLAHATPFVSDNGFGNLQKEQYEKLKVSLCTHFNNGFGNVVSSNKGLFTMLYDKEFFVQSEDLCSEDVVQQFYHRVVSGVRMDAQTPASWSHTRV